MEQHHEYKPEESSRALISLTPGEGIPRQRFQIRAWVRMLTRKAVLTLAAFLLLALPVSVVLNNRHDLSKPWRALDRFFHRPVANHSPVLAVDALGMTIDGKNLTLTGRKRVQQAAVEQLAQLHHIYAGWVPTDEDAVGSLRLKLQVDEAGNVNKIETVHSRLSSSDFAKVVFTEMRQWNFPAGVAESLEINLPLLFVPKGLDANTIVQWERRVGDGTAEQKIVQLAANRAMAPTPNSAPITEAAALRSAAANHAHGHIATARKAVLPIFKTTRALALRRQPRFASAHVHEVDADTELKLLERKGSWLKVRMADASAIGFVRKEYLRPVN